MNRHPITAHTATPRPAHAARPRERGFTLVELLVTIAIAAILIGLSAAPMSQMFASNRVQSEASSFVSDLMYARSEAIRRGQPVSLCASADNGASCLGTNAWGSGWVVFPDSTQCGSAVSPASSQLRIRAAFKGADTLGGTSAKSCVTFNRDGFSTNLGTGHFVFQVQTAPVVTSTTRCVGIDVGGRISTTKITSGTTCS